MADHPTWHVLITPTPEFYRLSDLLNDGSRDGSDIWITTTDLRVDQDLPGIPIDYATLESMGKCLYVRGIPPNATTDEVKGLFMPFGCVVKCPSLISLASQDIFRWVVMGTNEEAKFALDQLHTSFISSTERLFVSRALKPGTILTLVQIKKPADSEEVVDSSNEKTPKALVRDTSHEVTPKAATISTVYGHPSPSKIFPDLSPKKSISALSPEKSAADLSPKKAVPDLSPKKLSTPNISPKKPEVAVPLIFLSPPKREKVKLVIKPVPQPPIGTGRRRPGTTKPPSRLDRFLTDQDFPPLGSSALVKNSTPDASEAEKSKWLAKHKGLVDESSSEEKSTSDSAELDDQSLGGGSENKAESLKKAGKASGSIKDPTSPSSVSASATVPRSSWASIASSSNPDTKVINMHGSRPVDTAPATQPTARRVLSNPRSEESTDNDNPNRVVFLLNLPSSITLKDISEAVTEGPLAKIQLGPKDEKGTRYVGIIFQNGWEAESFYNTLQQERKLSRPSRFRFIVDAERGEEYYPDERILAMGEPLFATRRLTIVKAKFFFMFGEKQLREFCYKMVGEENVQLVWLYNGGNATVVFADVLSAIKVKNELDKRAASAGKPGGESPIWEDLTTSFSKDPCVQRLSLTTSLHD